MPAVLPRHLHHRSYIRCSFTSVQSHGAATGVRMKEALSKRLILAPLVIKIGRCATPPSLNPPVEMAANRCLCNKYNLKKKGKPENVTETLWNLTYAISNSKRFNSLKCRLREENSRAF